MSAPAAITVLYDPECTLCRRSALWLTHQAAYIAIEVMAAGSPAALDRYGDFGRLGDEMVVVADDGRIWWGSPDAYLVCLWALRRWRPWGERLASPLLSPLATGFFKRVSTHRKAIGALLGPPRCPDCVPAR